MCRRRGPYTSTRRGIPRSNTDTSTGTATAISPYAPLTQSHGRVCTSASWHATRYIHTPPPPCALWMQPHGLTDGSDPSVTRMRAASGSHSGKHTYVRWYRQTIMARLSHLMPHLTPPLIHRATPTRRHHTQPPNHLVTHRGTIRPRRPPTAQTTGPPHRASRGPTAPRHSAEARQQGGQLAHGLPTGPPSRPCTSCPSPPRPMARCHSSLIVSIAGAPGGGSIARRNSSIIQPPHVHTHRPLAPWQVRGRHVRTMRR